MEEKLLVQEMTAIMREADKAFETVGGSTRHYVRDVLLPLMEKKGLKIIKQGKTQAGAGWVNGDYGRLYDQVKGGNRTVCYVDYYWDRDTSKEPCRDITTIRADYMEFSARGISYGGPWDMDKEEADIKKEFIEECIRLNVEWLCEGTAAGREEDLTEDDIVFLNQCNIYIVSGGLQVMTENDEGGVIQREEVGRLVDILNRYETKQQKEK